MTSRRSTGHLFLERLVALTDRLVAGTDGVVLHSFPDLDDSVVALLREAPGDVDVTVLAEDATAARARSEALGLGHVRVLPRRSARGAWRYLRAGVAVSTHGMFGSRARGRGKRTVGLWHGEFGKLIGAFADEPPRHFDWVPVSSPLSRVVRSAEFGLHPRHIEVVGAPRQRLLRRPVATSAGARRSVVWAPTYRTSVTGLRRTDGDPHGPAAELAPDDPALQALLERHDAVLWFRPHPAAAQEVPEGGRVRTATDVALEQEGITFYELLAGADCLVTDYSSLWVDFVLRDRPLVSFCPDLARYRADRGLALEPHEHWFPGPVVTTGDDFLAALAAALARPDHDAARRAGTRAVLHAAPDQDGVGATWRRVAAFLAGRAEGA